MKFLDAANAQIDVGSFIIYTHGATDYLYFGRVSKLTDSGRIYVAKHDAEWQPVLDKNGNEVESWINHTHQRRVYILL